MRIFAIRVRAREQKRKFVTIEESIVISLNRILHCVLVFILMIIPVYITKPPVQLLIYSNTRYWSHGAVGLNVFEGGVGSF